MEEIKEEFWSKERPFDNENFFTERTVYRQKINPDENPFNEDPIAYFLSIIKDNTKGFDIVLVDKNAK